ncbi:MAG: hypothetical protein WCO89_12850 [Syntrophus sp. (in: bacteria)]
MVLPVIHCSRQQIDFHENIFSLLLKEEIAPFRETELTYESAEFHSKIAMRPEVSQ